MKRISWHERADVPRRARDLTDKERALADRYFRDALFHLAGCSVPDGAKLDSTTWSEPLAGRETLQDWASSNARPGWACGISILEAAANMVIDAWDNANIISKYASHPAEFEHE